MKRFSPRSQGSESHFGVSNRGVLGWKYKPPEHLALKASRTYFQESHKASLVAQMIRHLSPMLETWVRSLGWEDPLEKEMATHSSTLAWKIPWTEEPGGLQSVGSQRVGHDL